MCTYTIYVHTPLYIYSVCNCYIHINMPIIMCPTCLCSICIHFCMMYGYIHTHYCPLPPRVLSLVLLRVSSSALHRLHPLSSSGHHSQRLWTLY